MHTKQNSYILAYTCKYVSRCISQGNLIGLERKARGFFFPNLLKVKISKKSFCKKKLEIINKNYHKKYFLAIMMHQRFTRHQNYVLEWTVLGFLGYTVYQRWPIFALIEDIWNTKQLMTLEVIKISWWNLLWIITMNLG